MRTTTHPLRKYGIGAGAAAAFLPLLLATTSASAATSDTTPTATATATLSGTVVSTDGTPVAGAGILVYYRNVDETQTPTPVTQTAADGTFSTAVTPDPGGYFVAAQKRGWQDTTFPEANPTAGQNATLSPVSMEPVGYADFSLRSKAGRLINSKYISLAIGDCTEPVGLYGTGSSQCGVVSVRESGYTGTADKNREFSLHPGTYSLRFEVSNPRNDTVRHVTSNVTVTGGDAYSSVSKTLEFKADPTTRATVTTKHFRRDHKDTVTVTLPTYTDEASPKLKTTLKVNGTRIANAHTVYRTGKAGLRKAVVTLSAKHTDAKKLHVKATVQGTTDYSGATSKTVTLTKK